MVRLVVKLVVRLVVKPQVEDPLILFELFNRNPRGCLFNNRLIYFANKCQKHLLSGLVSPLASFLVFEKNSIYILYAYFLFVL